MSWLDLEAIAIVDLRMTREEFLASSPREFDAFCQRLEARDRKQQFSAALICSVLAEINRDRQKRSRPFTPQDFMPQPERVQTDEEQVEMMSLMFGCGPDNPGKENFSRKPLLRPRRVKHHG